MPLVTRSSLASAAATESGASPPRVARPTKARALALGLLVGWSAVFSAASFSTLAWGADDAPKDASSDADGDAPTGAAPRVAPRKTVDDDLVRKGSRLLDDKDLLQRGGTLLPQAAAPPPAVANAAAAASVAARASGASPAAAAAAGRAAAAAIARGESPASAAAAGRAAAAAVESGASPAVAAAAGAAAAAAAAAESDGGLSDEAGSDPVTDAGDGASPETDAATAAAAANSSVDAGTAAAPAQAGRGGRGGGTGSRPPTQVLAMTGVEDSPLAKLGVPAAAVPAAATVVATGFIAFWPALLKTLTGLAKAFAAAFLKNRGKKTKKVDPEARSYQVLGLAIRPVEVGAIAIAAFVYGIAVCYVFQGRKMEAGFVARQEGLVLAIYFTRSIARFVYERVQKITTQYHFWFAGGLMCLASAYLGTALGTVGFETEASSGPADAKRIVTMKAWLLGLAFILAVAFCLLNMASPAKVFQSGRLMMSGAALAEVLPITPMPGKKIFDANKRLWLALFLVVVPGFFVINFVL